MSQFYDNALRETYRFAAASIASAAVVGRLVGPVGKRGRVVNVSTVVTTGVTDAGGTVTVGPNGAASPVTHTVPISSANAVLAIPVADLVGETDLAADTLVEITAGGEPTAGAADIVVTIDWF